MDIEQDNLIEELYMKNYHKLYTKALLCLKDQEEAKDLIQDVFKISLLKKSILYKHPNKVGWLFKVLDICLKRKLYENCYKTKNNKHKINTTISFINISEITTYNENLIYVDNYFNFDAFKEFETFLSKRQMKILILKFYYDKNTSEISKIFSITCSNTTSIISRTYKKIKKYLKNM